MTPKNRHFFQIKTPQNALAEEVTPKLDNFFQTKTSQNAKHK
jgi:hypothetical protein